MPANPNYTWGYGILDAAAAVKASQPSAGTPVTVVEFYNQSLDHYFVTYVADEIAKLDNGTFVGWARTGPVVQGVRHDAERHVGGVPDLHPAGQGRRPLLRARHEASATAR